MEFVLVSVLYNIAIYTKMNTYSKLCTGIIMTYRFFISLFSVLVVVLVVVLVASDLLLLIFVVSGCLRLDSISSLVNLRTLTFIWDCLTRVRLNLSLLTFTRLSWNLLFLRYDRIRRLAIVLLLCNLLVC